jgi:Ca2+-binding EF-hand superfamily protein
MRWISTFFLTLALLLSGISAHAEDPAPAHDPKAAHAQADLNGDGQIDRREFHLRMVEVFYHADVDKTGFLKPEELNKATVFEEDFSEADKNGDGKISLYEFIEYRFDAFDEADTDSNGLLSVDEVTAAFES